MTGIAQPAPQRIRRGRRRAAQASAAPSARVRRQRELARRLGFMLAVLPAMAQAADARAQDDDFSSRTLTGDWNGEREALRRRGIGVYGDYVSETFGVVHGGLRRGVRYAQQVRVGADFDMGRLAGWSAGTFHLTVNNRAGRSVSEELVGNRLPVQETYGGQYTRLAELSYDQDLLDRRLNLKLGFWSMGNDLGGVVLLTNFVSAAFCAHPVAMSGNSGWYNYPTARWGVQLRYRLSPALTLRTGVFQVNPTSANRSRAFSLFARGTTGALLPLELEYDSGGGSGPGHYTGHYKFGGYYETSDTARRGRDGEVGGRHGFYLLADQVVYRERADSDRGLTLFGQVMGSDRNTAQISDWYALGGLYKGIFPGRDNDTVALGYVRAVINRRLTQAAPANGPGYAQEGPLTGLPNAEGMIELNYGYWVKRWLHVRPAVQYVIDPGTYRRARTPNALIAGVQVKLQF